MKWSKPKFNSLAMNAEIGAYQNDFDGDYPPFVAAEASQTSALRSATEANATPRRNAAR